MIKLEVLSHQNWPNLLVRKHFLMSLFYELISEIMQAVYIFIYSRIVQALLLPHASSFLKGNQLSNLINRLIADYLVKDNQYIAVMGQLR